MTQPSTPSAGRDLAAALEADGDASSWFESRYAEAAAGRADLPWDHGSGRPQLVEWLDTQPDRRGQQALVVGCGLGHDAELVASRGLITTAFDVSTSAIAGARERYPGSTVDYRVASVLELPADWVRAFDLVVESLTVQSLPPDRHPEAIRAIAGTVAPGGTLFVFASRPVEGRESPPWPLTRDEVDAFAADGVTMVRLEELDLGVMRLWRAELQRPADGTGV